MLAMDAKKPLTVKRSLRDMLRFERFIAVGANSGGDQVRSWLCNQGKEVLGYADLSASLLGTKRQGLDVLALGDCVRLLDKRTAFVIGTIHQREVAELLVEELDINPLRVFPFVNPMFAAHYGEGVQDNLAPQHARVRAWLSDEASRAYFDRVTAFYRTLDPRHLTPHPMRFGEYGYDAPGANPKSGATIVDCGAFTGDTFGDFISATGGDCRIVAFEAFPPNFEKLVANIAHEGLGDIVEPRQMAVGREAGTIAIAGDATIADATARIGKASGTQDHRVACDTLDNLFLGRRHTPIDYLKIDIEGATLDALVGGARMLREHRPVVAVAAYHTPAHVIEIADFLHETLRPCRLYAAHEPKWHFQIHYIAVPDERALTSVRGASGCRADPTSDRRAGNTAA